MKHHIGKSMKTSKYLLIIYTIFIFSAISISHVKAFQTDVVPSDSLKYFYSQANNFQKKRDFVNANKYLSKIYKIHIQNKEWKKYYKTQRQILFNLLNSQNFDAFLTQQKFLLKSNTEVRPPDDSFKALLYRLLAYVYNVQGNPQKAIIYQKKALSILKEANDIKRLASIYMNLGNSFSALGAFDKALSYANKALQMFKRSKDSLKIANTYGNISLIFINQKVYKKALIAAKKSLVLKEKILPPDHSSIDQSHQSIGIIYNESDSLAKALQYFKKSLYFSEKKYSNNHLWTASTYLNIASVYQKQGKSDLALRNYTKALRIWKKYKQNTAITNLYNSLAKIYLTQNNYNKSLIAYQTALTYNSKTFKDSLDIGKNPGINQYTNGRLFLQTLQGKASVLLAKGDRPSLEIALQTYQLCDEVIQKSRQQYVRYQDKLALAKISAEVYENALKTCYQLIKKQPAKEAQYTELAFHFSERNKASILREALQEANAKFGLPKNLQEQEQDLKVNLAYYEKQLANAQLRKDSVKVGRFQNKLFALNRQHEKLTQMLETRYPRYYQLKYNTALASVAEIKKHLPAKALLVEYFTTPSTLYAFVVAQNQCKMLALPGGSGFRRVLRKYARSIKMRKRAAEFAKTSYAAYQQLLQPLEAYMKGKDQLIVVGDDLLLSIPFEPLITQKA